MKLSTRRKILPTISNVFTLLTSVRLRIFVFIIQIYIGDEVANTLSKVTPQVIQIKNLYFLLNRYCNDFDSFLLLI